MQTSNYRGISLTSVTGKLFERIILKMITPVLKERGIPHYTQTAFQSGISCADPTEVVQEAVRSYGMLLRSRKSIRFCGVLCFAPPPVQIWYQWENVEDYQIFLYQSKS